MLDVIDAFQERNTRDELGFGGIRDGLADSLFPGTSTIQTRARYFLFVPWMYRWLEERRIPSAQIAREARTFEQGLIRGLLDGCEHDGVIGARARERLQRPASNVYWLGLRAWGIRLFDGSQDQYYRSLDRHYGSHIRRRARIAEEEQYDEPNAINWHAGLPPPPTDFPHIATFRLQPEEAEYLSERIRLSQPHSLLAFLAAMAFPQSWVTFPWLHPQIAEFPDRLREQVEHARNFSELVHGAALLYNLMIAELVNWEEQRELYKTHLTEWADQLGARQRELAAWDLNHFWRTVYGIGARVSVPTRRFVTSWVEQVRDPAIAAGVASNSVLRTQVFEREVALKGPLARLKYARAREHWPGQSGAGQLNFRWHRAQQMLNDIRQGLAAR